MVRLSVADLKPGMVTARPVEDMEGRRLCPADTELTESMLRSLARRPVAFVCIHERSEGEARSADELRREIDERLRALFSATEQDSQMVALREEIAEYLYGTAGVCHDG